MMQLKEKNTTIVKSNKPVKNYPTRIIVPIQDIASCLNGIARFTYFRCIEDSKGLGQTIMELHSIEEGEYVQGKKNGYCRIINANTGNVSVGFYEEGKVHGKYCQFSAEGRFIS